MTPLLLDTNVIARLVRRDSAVARSVREAVQVNRQIFLSPVVDYEVRRGMLRKQATSLFERYEELLPLFRYEDLNAGDWQRAAELWAFSRNVGMPLPDADIVIAAQAMHTGSVLVTDNTRHYELFGPLGLLIEKWDKD